MGSKATRSAFVASLCAGVAMIGVSVHGVLGVDAQLERSAFATQQRTIEEIDSVRVLHGTGGRECPAPAAAPSSDQRI
jgi:hypothetical protein